MLNRVFEKINKKQILKYEINLDDFEPGEHEDHHDHAEFDLI